MKKLTSIVLLLFVLTASNGLADLVEGENGLRTGAVVGTKDGKVVATYTIEPFADLRNAELSGLDLSSVDLEGADLTNAKLYDTNFRNANLNRAKFTDAEFGIQTQFHNANLSNANFENNDYVIGIFYRTDLTNANFKNSNVPSGFNECIITGADFKDAKKIDGLRCLGIPKAMPEGTVLANGNFVGPSTYLADSNLNGSSLKNANLEGTNLEDTTLIGVSSGGIISDAETKLPENYKIKDGFLIGPEVDLSDADLSRINLYEANLRGANLSGANLTRSNLEWANLEGANFTEANLTKTNFTSANLTGVIFQGANVLDAIFDDTVELGDLKDQRISELETQLVEANATIEIKNALIAELSKEQTIDEIQDGRLGSIVLTPIPNTNTAILNIDIEQSDDLKTWTLYRKILESISMPEGKKFYRFALDK